MKEQIEVLENHLAQEPPWLISNAHFWYDRDLPTNNDNEKNQPFLEHKEKHKNNKETYTDKSNIMERKVHFAVVFRDITRRSLHSHSWNDSNKSSIKREDKRLVIYTDSQSSMQSIEYKITQY